MKKLTTIILIFLSFSAFAQKDSLYATLVDSSFLFNYTPIEIYSGSGDKPAAILDSNYNLIIYDSLGTIKCLLYQVLGNHEYGMDPSTQSKFKRFIESLKK